VQLVEAGGQQELATALWPEPTPLGLGQVYDVLVILGTLVLTGLQVFEVAVRVARGMALLQKMRATAAVGHDSGRVFDSVAPVRPLLTVGEALHRCVRVTLVTTLAGPLKDASDGLRDLRHVAPVFCG